MNELDAVYAFFVAATLAAALTPLAKRLAVRVGAVDAPSDRGLSDRPMPRLGALAILVAVVVAGARLLPDDSGSNLLGLLLGCIAVQGSLKTNALIALAGPLVILAVPFLDTSFVIAKRIRDRVPIYAPDSEHFHHRFARMGFTQRRTVLYLY